MTAELRCAYSRNDVENYEAWRYYVRTGEEGVGPEVATIQRVVHDKRYAITWGEAMGPIAKTEEFVADLETAHSFVERRFCDRHFLET